MLDHNAFGLWSGNAIVEKKLIVHLFKPHKKCPFINHDKDTNITNTSKTAKLANSKMAPVRWVANLRIKLIERPSKRVFIQISYQWAL